MNKIFIFGLLMLLSTGSFAGSDLAKEKRWASQVVDALLDGEAITLNDGKNDFLGIITEADSPKPAALIVLHGIGVHPDYPEVVNPLRVGLVERGWTTLSLQLPVLPNEAEGKDYLPIIPDALPRIRAGIDYLKESGAQKIVVVAHSLGTVMSGYSLANNPADIQGFVAIGMGVEGTQYLEKISMPVFDLYGSEDLPDVIKQAPNRQKASAKNKDYTQIKVQGADHFFNGKESDMLSNIANWLSKRNF